MGRKQIQLAEEILIKSSDVYRIIETNFSQYPKGVERICALLFKQVMGLFRGILLLCQKDLVNEAKILLRSLSEVGAFLLYISDEDHENRCELYLHSAAIFKKSAVDEFNKSALDGQRKVDTQFYEENERLALEYFRKKDGFDKTAEYIRRKYTYSYAVGKLQGDNKNVFNTFDSMLRRPISAIAHGQEPIAFVGRDSEGVSLKVKPSDADFSYVISTSCLITLQIVINMDKFFELKQHLLISQLEADIDEIIQLDSKEGNNDKSE